MPNQDLIGELSELKKRASAATDAFDVKQAARLWQMLAERGREHPDELNLGCGETPESADLKYAGMLYQADDVEAAVDVYEKLRDSGRFRGPAYGELLRGLTLAYAPLGRLEEGRVTGEEFVAANSDDPVVWKTLGLIYGGLAQQAIKRREPATALWQLGVDAANWVLIGLNPCDEAAFKIRHDCVEGMRGVFMPEMLVRLQEFVHCVDLGLYGDADKIINDLMPFVVEHVAELLRTDAQQSLNTAREFFAALRKEEMKSGLDLEPQFDCVFAQIQILIMWACHETRDYAGADHALFLAHKHAPNSTLPYVSSALLEFARGHPNAVGEPLRSAEIFVKTDHDKYLMALAYQAIGQFSVAMKLANSVNLVQFRQHVYHPDRSVRAFLRFKAGLAALVAAGPNLPFKEMDLVMVQNVIRNILGDTSMN